MEPIPQNDNATYSPSILIELHLHGKRFFVSAMSPTFLKISTADTAPPGAGTVVMYLDGEPYTFEVDLVDGITADRKIHACRTRKDVADSTPVTALAG